MENKLLILDQVKQEMVFYRLSKLVVSNLPFLELVRTVLENYALLILMDDKLYTWGLVQEAVVFWKQRM